MNLYVVGFLFDDEGERVVLIEKQRPEWQRGKLNGVGGHIEDGETQLAAMIREFGEETGVHFPEWKLFCILCGIEKRYIKTTARFEVYFYYGFSTTAFDTVKQTTDEKPERCDVRNLGSANTLPNLQWLIPMALSGRRGESADYFIIEEQDPRYRTNAG